MHPGTPDADMALGHGKGLFAAKVCLGHSGKLEGTTKLGKDTRSLATLHPLEQLFNVHRETGIAWPLFVSFATKGTFFCKQPILLP